MSSRFLEDTKLLNEKVRLEAPVESVTMLKAAFLPYYIDPDSLALTVVLKRELMAGAYSRFGMKMGLSVLTTELPQDNPLTIQEAYANIGINAEIQNPIPYGCIMIEPTKTTETYEIVLAQIEPPKMLDADRGIILQKKGEYEIGVVAFDDLVTAIQENYIQDILTRHMLSELYILVVNEQQAQNSNNVPENDLIGGGANLPADYHSAVSEVAKTIDISDEVLEQNAQMDFGSIYSKVSSQPSFEPINKK